jgi:O-antigen/teichoic acid export membrane protein
MSSGSKKPSYLFLLGAGFIVGIGFWLGSDIFPSLLSSDNIWDSILIILGFLSIINFVIWFSLSVFWNVILSFDKKRNMSYAVKGENLPEEVQFRSENLEDRVNQLFTDQNFKNSFSADLSHTMEFDENVKFSLAIWGIFSLIFSGLMIWLFWESVTSFLMQVLYASFYIAEILSDNENLLQEVLEKNDTKVLIIWPLLLLGAAIFFVKIIIFCAGVFAEIRKYIKDKADNGK